MRQFELKFESVAYKNNHSSSQMIKSHIVFASNSIINCSSIKNVVIWLNHILYLHQIKTFREIGRNKR